MTRPFAIVGMGCVFPGAQDVPAYWRSLLRADTSVQRTPPLERFDWRAFYSPDRDAPDKGYSALAGIVEGVPFEPAKFGISEAEAQDLYPIEHWYLTSLAECRAGLPIRGQCGLFVATTGVCDPTVEALFRGEIGDELTARLPEGIERERQAELLRQALRRALPARSGPGERRELMLAPLWRRLGERQLGPVVRYLLVDAACASSFYAIDHGLRALHEGRVDIAFCGGVFLWGPVGQVYFSKLSGLSAVGCRPLDAAADGTVFGDGAGFVAVRRLDDALADGDPIQAVILGMGTSSDGKGKAVYAPAARGQVLALRRAYASSGVDPRTVQVLEAHATGTPVGDATEISALSEFFGPLRGPRAIPLGSVKGLFGHLGWAAGAASVIKLVLGMQQRRIPPQPGITRLMDALLDPACPFVVPTAAEPWPENQAGLPRRAAASGFGFGGSNAHIILEEFVPERWRHEGTGERRPSRPRPTSTAPLAIVSVGAVFPEAASAAEAIDATRRGVPLGAGRFAPDVQGHARRMRMMPRMVRVTDQAQLLVLQAAREAIADAGPLPEALREDTDVYVGYHGPLNAQVSGSKRIFHDWIVSSLRADPELSRTVDLDSLLPAWRSTVLDAIPETTEDSFPGVMGNLLAGRISNFLDLRGANQTIDAGPDAFARAIEAAASALHAGSAKVALATAAACATQPSVAALARGPAGEGAVALALMTPAGAQAAGLPVRALLVPAAGGTADDPSIDLQGASGAIALLRALGGSKGEIVKIGERSFSVVPHGAVEATPERPTGALRAVSAVPRLRRATPALVALRAEGSTPPLRAAVHAWSAVRAPTLGAGDDLVIVGDLGPCRDVRFSRALSERFLADFELLRAHSAVAPSGARVGVVLLDSVEHPVGGLYAGLLRSLALERPDVPVRLLLTDRSSVEESLAQLHVAFALPDVDVFDIAGQFYGERLVDAPAVTVPIDLHPGDVVIAFGGARGVTFEAARALGVRGARLALVGSSPAGDGVAPPPRAAWLALARKAEPKAPIRLLNQRYEALKARAEATANVAELRAAGVDAAYFACDVRDAAAVSAVFSEVRRRWGRVDGVLYGASTSGQLARLPALLRDGVETNLAVKVMGLENVVRETEGASTWLVVFSSISSLGADGMATYAGANAFQNRLAEQLRRRGVRALAINWPAWTGAGAAARDAALLEKMAAEGRFSVIAPDDGRALLVDELRRGLPAGVIYLLGDPEAGFLQRRLGERWPLLDVIDRPSPNVLVGRRTFSLSRDTWLAEHCVDGDPVVPGTFELEMAAEAACALTGDASVRIFEDIRFELFVKLFGRRPTTVEVRAERRSDGAIAVAISSDVLDRRGRPLVRGRRHFSVLVRTGAPDTPPAPTLALTSPFRPVPDPYHLPGSSVVLTDRFVTLTNTGAGDGFTAARTRLDPRVEGTPFDGFITPALLLDGILRSAALQSDERGALPVLAPLALSRVEFYAPGNDLELTARHGSLDVRFRVDGPIDAGPGGRFEASAGGVLVLAAEDARGYVKSIVHGTATTPSASPASNAPDPTVRLVRDSEPPAAPAPTGIVETSLRVGLSTSPWLADAARFDGTPVLPGSFQLEMAAAAALRLWPGASVVALEDIRFERLIRLHGDRETALTLRATRSAERVDVELLVAHPVADRAPLRVSRMTVVLGKSLPAPPEPLSQGPALPEPMVPGVFYLPVSRLHLGGVFAVVASARDDGEVLTAEIRPEPAIDARPSAHHVIPPVLLDLVLQPCARRAGPWLTSAIPAALGRVRLFVAGSDRSVQDDHGPLTIRTVRLRHASDLVKSQIVGRNGRVLLQVEDFRTSELGWVHPETGQTAARPLQAEDEIDSRAWSRYEVCLRERPPVNEGLDVRQPDLEDAVARWPTAAPVPCRLTGPEGLDSVDGLVDQLVRLGHVAGATTRTIQAIWAGGGAPGRAFARAFVASLADELPNLDRQLRVGIGSVDVVAVPTESTTPALNPGTVMLTGGGRGITAVLSRRLLTLGARLVLVGRTDPAEGAEDWPLTFVGFLARLRATRPSVSVAEARAAHERFLAARETLANLIALRALGDVEWVTADLCDPEAARRAVSRASARFGRVDVLVHAAGIERSAELRAKTRQELARIIGTKVDGLRHLLSAFGETLPSRMLLVGSVNAVLGAAGQTDYTAASAWLGEAARELRSRGVAARCVALPAVRGVGMAARRPEVLDHLRALGHRIFTADEAAELLLEALSEGPAYTVAAPAALLEQRGVVILSAPESMPWTTASERPCEQALDRVATQGPVHRATRLLDADRDPMLLAHLAGNVPCLPGAAEIELVLQVVRHVGAGMAVRITDLRYHHFVKVFPGRPRRVRVECVDEGEMIQAKLLGDVVHRDGRVLRRDLIHWSGTVQMAAAYPQSPAARAAPTQLFESPPPCYLAGAPLYYTAAMRSITWRGVNAQGEALARVDAGDRALMPWARELPWEVADALAITPAAPGGVVPVIDRIGSLELFAPVAVGPPEVPTTFWIHTAPLAREGEFMLGPWVEVVDAEGRLVARATDLAFRALTATLPAEPDVSARLSAQSAGLGHPFRAS